MSTNDYLEKLTYDQLVYARNRADELIRNINDEQKRIVWCVEDDAMRVAVFPVEKYLDAANKLLKVAEKNAKNPQQTDSFNPRYWELHLVSIKVPESEYLDWIPSVKQ